MLLVYCRIHLCCLPSVCCVSTVINLSALVAPWWGTRGDKLHTLPWWGKIVDK